ncbi:MAG: PrsW family glutamic-type intramembrane protease [Scytonema sp. PMC 1069.18]|nr:PrsW family glutamic-type intramembrane protease [Scytonema sp. PMC 1069.18]MEC4883924.1 PrsW family glutamic-type intramembrane protease [Scytonema sp. PMC 1070.18]
MTDFYIILWAVVPPLLLLGFYSNRIPTSPSVMRLLFFFICGAISGFLAFYLESAFENAANQVVTWRLIQRTFFGVILRQILEVAPIEEGCKLGAVFIPIYYLQRQYRLRTSTIYLFSLAASLGFTAQENWVYLFYGFYGAVSILERLISIPVHAIFSAPWGYALAIFFGSRYLHRYTDLLLKSWFNSVICHALVNIFSLSGRFLFPLNLLVYGLFPFFLWMYWRLEQLLRRVQGQDAIALISSHKPKQRHTQKLLVALTLILGGNAIFMMFVALRSFLNQSQRFYPDAMLFIVSRLFLSVIFGLLSWFIYRYLRQLVHHRRYF